MLRHGRLRDAELGLDDGRDCARALLTIGEQLEYPAPHRIPQDIERMHRANLKP
jgi:hypothetical protein